MFGPKDTDPTTSEEKKAILDFDGKKYDINTLPDDIKEIIKGLQIADTQFKKQQDNLKLIDILACLATLLVWMDTWPTCSK